MVGYFNFIIAVLSGGCIIGRTLGAYLVEQIIKQLQTTYTNILHYCERAMRCVSGGYFVSW